MSDGGLSEELEDVTEDEESECFKHLHFYRIRVWVVPGLVGD